ncbi:hypothetical protein MMC20_003642 [Loxospora ochrophaea]|nr:hypothetical protein [Loxospora ochrophaea]
MSDLNTPPPNPSAPPHIRLNSQQDDLPTNAALSNRPLGPIRQDSSRSLVPQRPPTSSSLRNQTSANQLYTNAAAESAQSLLPPSRSRARRFRDDESQSGSPPDPSGVSSRRTSWSSDGASRDSRVYGSNPFDDSRAPSRAGSDDENVNTQTVSEKYNILPSAGLLLFPEDVEKDDWLHNPDPNEKPDRRCDIFNKRAAVNLGGLAFLLAGLLFLFIGFPVLTFTQEYVDPPDPCDSDPDCINIGKISLLKNQRTGLIDPDTPQSAMTKTAVDGTKLQLMFSDEFNTDGRTFYPNDDPFFTGVDLWYGVTRDLEWYDPDAITTQNGVLEIRFDAFQNHGLNYRSGMLQSWNQMCFQGGHLEAAISLPGRGDTIGFWPGFWSMGNLGRPGYAATTDGLWPYSYDNVCDAGITKNQSSIDGLSYLPGMRLPACACDGEDHPGPNLTSRSSPEIDVIEASVGYLGPGQTNAIGSVSQSVQFAPFDIFYAPDYNYVEVYDDSITAINNYRGGPFQEAASGLTNLNNDWYDGNQYQTYAFEYTPGKEGAITWFVGDQKTWTLDARAMRPNGNTGQRIIPNEPMALIMNFGMSPGFSDLNLTGIGPLLPATMRFDYVRLYQDPNAEATGCDPPDHPTAEYITNHPVAYQNPNKTLWEDTPYSWPKNSLVDGC